MVKASAYHAGDRWFDPRPPHFAENGDFFMIFEVYLQSDSDCKLAGVPKEFKSRRRTGRSQIISYIETTK